MGAACSAQDHSGQRQGDRKAQHRNSRHSNDEAREAPLSPRATGGEGQGGEEPTPVTHPSTNAEERRKIFESGRICFEHLVPPEGNYTASARKMHSAVPVGDHTIISFGGISRKEALSNDLTANAEATMQASKAVINKQTWRVSVAGPEWTLVHTKGDTPSSRANHRAAAIQGTMYVVGSHNKQCRDVYAYNMAFNQWRREQVQGEGPQAVGGHSMATSARSLIVFGGEGDHGISNELHVFNTESKTWAQVPAAGPLVGDAVGKSAHEIATRLKPRRDHSAALYGDRMLVFGGFGVQSEGLEFIEFGVGTREWTAVEVTGPTPPNRGGHCCAMHGAYMVIFGGMRHGEYLNDLHVFNAMTSVWTPVALSAVPGAVIPQPRAFMACVTIGDDMYVHGGGDDTSIYSDFLRISVHNIARTADPLQAHAVLSTGQDVEPSPLWDLI